MKHIYTDNAPAPLGPYSQAVEHNGIVQVAMQIAVKPEKQHQPELSLPDQLKQVLANIQAILEEAESDLEHCMQVTIYATDLSQGPEINKIYEEFFNSHNKPARTVVEVKALPLDYKIAAEAVGAVKT